MFSELNIVSRILLRFTQYSVSTYDAIKYTRYEKYFQKATVERQIREYEKKISDLDLNSEHKSSELETVRYAK